MNKFFYAVVLFALFSINSKVAIENKFYADVYVCYSATSVAYHSNQNCKGLSRCTHKIIAVSENDAIKKYQKRMCKWCYK